MKLQLHKNKRNNKRSELVFNFFYYFKKDLNFNKNNVFNLIVKLVLKQ